MTADITMNIKKPETSEKQTEVNVRKEGTEKHDVDQWCKACEVNICCNINHAEKQPNSSFITCSTHNNYITSDYLELLIKDSH